MDTELIVAVAQIATGLATLVVAIFLAGQILLQRKALDRAHPNSSNSPIFLFFSGNNIVLKPNPQPYGSRPLSPKNL